MKKMKSLFIVVLMVALTFGIMGCTTAPADEEYQISNAYLTVDINPSVEIITGEDGLVAEVNPLNDDAAVMLLDTDFAGLAVDDVVVQILALATELGYIGFDEENAIVVTAAANTEEDTTDLEEKIAEKVQAFVQERQMNLEVIKASIGASDEIKTQAEELGITIGKMKLITAAMAIDTELTLEAAAEMSVRDLNGIIRSYRNEVKEFVKEELIEQFRNVKMDSQYTFKVTRVELIYNEMVLATDDVFADLIGESTTTVQAIKDLYLAYWNALLAAKEETEAEPTNPLVETELNELNEERAALQGQIEELIHQLRQMNRGTANFDQLQTQLEGLREQAEAVHEQWEQVRESVQEQAHYSYHKGFKFNGENKKWEYSYEFNHMRAFGQITEEYEALFAEIGIDLEALENLFEDAIATELEGLHQQMQTELQNLGETLREQGEVIRAYMAEEKEVLREVQRNRAGKDE